MPFHVVELFHSLLGVSVSSMGLHTASCNLHGIQAAWVRPLRCSSPLCRSWCSLEQWSALRLVPSRNPHPSWRPRPTYSIVGVDVVPLWWELWISSLPSSALSQVCSPRPGCAKKGSAVFQQASGQIPSRPIHKPIKTEWWKWCSYKFTKLKNPAPIPRPTDSFRMGRW